MLKPPRPNRADFPRSQSGCDAPIPASHPCPPRSRRPTGISIGARSSRRLPRPARSVPACPRDAAAAPLKYARNPRMSLKEEPNSFEDITTYNNFYEFGTDKSDPARNAGKFKPQPWSVAISGECARPGTYTLEDILKPHALEERIYRLRCVEAWSMVIPWVGFPLGRLAEALRADLEGQVRRVQDRAAAERDAGPALPRARLAVRRRPAHRRGHASPRRCSPWVSTARPCRTRTARRCAWWCRGSTASRASSRSSRSASPSASPPTSWNISAPQEYGFFANVNPSRRPSALEPGAGTAHRWQPVCLEAGDAAVQRLRRPGCLAVQGHGPAQVLLSRPA